jgi:diguanylate cyclase (GGDEF)-like protein
MSVVKGFYGVLWQWANRGALSEDGNEERVKKAVLTLVAGIIAFLAVFWGSLYVVLGYPVSGAIPLGYAAISFASILYFFTTKRFEFFRFSQLLLILLLPFLLQWSLGGFSNGSAVMVWAFFAPLAAMLFADLAYAAGWLLAFLVLTLVSGFVDLTPFAAQVRPMPRLANVAFFVMNMGAGFVSIYFVLNSFVRDRERSHLAAVKAREALEQANLELQRNQARISELMLTDPLTGAGNRRHLDERFLLEVDRARRYDKQLSVVIADLDHFKAINDAFGHNVGDEVLKAVAAVMRSKIRTTDFLARFGGEEFVLLLPETGRAGAELLAERIRRALELEPVAGLDQPVTASFGAATALASESAKEVLKRADDALYQAKNAGRNRLVVADSPG